MENKTNKTNDSKSAGRGPMVTVRLTNGKLMRIPFKNYRETLDRLEKRLMDGQKQKIKDPFR